MRVLVEISQTPKFYLASSRASEVYLLYHGTVNWRIRKNVNFQILLNPLVAGAVFTNFWYIWVDLIVLSVLPVSHAAPCDLLAPRNWVATGFTRLLLTNYHIMRASSSIVGLSSIIHNPHRNQGDCGAQISVSPADRYLSALLDERHFNI